MSGMPVYDLLHQLPRDEFHRDHLLELLERCGYPRPGDRISALRQEGAILKVAGGWYVLGDSFRRRSLHLRWLSNIMRASVVSLQYALWHYGLIPEHVEVLTAITPLRSAFYETATGLFSYLEVPRKAFRTGTTIALLPDSEGRDERFLIATPAKALADLVQSEHGLSASTDWRAYFEDDIRLYPEYAGVVSSVEMLTFAEAYASPTLTSLALWLEKKEESYRVG